MVIITGTYPPACCGVGDYVQHLLNTPAGKKWKLFYRTPWSLGKLKTYMSELKKETDDVINLQYPTVGYGSSIVPHLLAIYAAICLHKRLFITLHEYSQLGWKGRLAIRVLFLFAHDIIFTTSFEMRCAQKHNPWLRKGHVIKIRSNIPAATTIRPMKERQWDMGYFGYLRPQKGLEEFLEVAEQLQQSGKRVYIMGQVQPEFEAFHRPLLQRMKEKGIAYFGNNTQEEVAQRLADTKIMYLPYPDGLSERRGSFLAAVVNGASVVSTAGHYTSENQKSNFALITPENASDYISTKLDDEEWLNEQQQHSLNYSVNCVPTTWQQIAEEYERIVK